MRALHEKISPGLTAALPRILSEVENLPYATGGRGSDDSVSSKQTNHESRFPLRAGAALLNPKVQAVIQREGYTLLTEGSMRLKPTIGKAIAHYGRSGSVALKLLPGGTEELQILKRLHAFQSEANHTIKLLDVFNVPLANGICDIIVMPWQMMLTKCLRENYFPQGVESLRSQFLEGVAFLHEHKVAHLDLKPANVLVHGRLGSLSPRLSVIDFGLSVFVGSEEDLVEGYRGTPSWVAPEVGAEHGPAVKYSAILADRWSCGKVLLYFADFLPAGCASIFGPTCAGLISLDPSKRPPLSTVLQALRGASVEKRGSEEGGATGAPKRLHVAW